MLPGNRPEDSAWEDVHFLIDDAAAENYMSDQDVFVAWTIGLAAYLRARSLGAKFPHDGPEPDICDPNPEL